MEEGKCEKGETGTGKEYSQKLVLSVSHEGSRTGEPPLNRKKLTPYTRPFLRSIISFSGEENQHENFDHFLCFNL